MSENDCAISIYRDQADELRRDLDAGLIDQAAYDAARSEIEARALRAARALGTGFLSSRRSPLLAGVVSLVAIAGTLGVYVFLGSPDAADQPLAARKSEQLTRMAESGDVNARIRLLIEETQENPDSFENWWTLAQSYAAIGDHASSADAYRRAAELSGDRPAVLSAYGEAMTLANGNKVPQAARLIFEQVLQKAPDPRARYYVALAKAQAQDFEAALEDWTRLARESEPQAPWMPIVRRDIVNMARFLQRDVTDYLPDASEMEIARAGGADAAATEGGAPSEGELVARLEADPKDYKSWIALAEVRAMAGENAAAAEALDNATREFAGAPFVLAKIDEAARALGLDMMPASTTRGPDAADIAAASQMSKSEQDEMIAGMVAGLSARLEEQPEDRAGWLMLVRSYNVLGNTEKARDAVSRARDAIPDDPEFTAQLDQALSSTL
jgi:cytochrome c-type biogenesis protein CcmH